MRPPDDDDGTPGSVVASVHVSHFIAPIRRLGGLIVAAGFLQQKSDMLLPEDAHVQDAGRLEGVHYDVSVQECIVMEPGEDQEEPGYGHNQENQSEHYEAESVKKM